MNEAVSEVANEPATARGRYDLAERYLRAAMAWYAANGRPGEAREAMAVLAGELVHLSRTDELRDLVVPALAEMDVETEPLAPRLLNQLARSYLWDDRPGDAMEPIEEGLRIAERMRLEAQIALLERRRGAIRNDAVVRAVLDATGYSFTERRTIPERLKLTGP